MPYSDPMTWVPKENRWVKRLGGRSFYFVPKKHGLEPSAAASRDAMRAWWNAQAEMLSPTCVPGSALAVGRMLEAYAGRKLEAEEVPCMMLSLVNHLDTMPKPQSNIIMRAILPPEKYQQIVDGVEKLLDVAPIEKSRLIGHQIDKWLEGQQAKLQIGKLGKNSLRNYKQVINLLREKCGKQLVDAIDNVWIENLFNALAAESVENLTRNNRWSVWMTFVDYLDTNNLIKKPKQAMKLTFPRSIKQKKLPWTLEEFRAEHDKADNDMKKLVLLLAANCSFYASDIAVCFNHYNAATGTIFMAREKTKRACSPSTYYLWPETKELMDKVGAKLLGRYKWIVKQVWSTPLKQLRHTTKSFIKNSKFNGYIVDMTGEKGPSIDDKFYCTSLQANIKKGFAYLRTCYGF